MKNLMICAIILLWGNSQVQADSLEDYLVMAAKNNPGLHARYAQYEAALERVSQVGALPDPTLTFGYFISPVETRLGPQKARLSLTQMFPWFGTLKSQKDSADLTAKALFQAFIDARNALYFQVSSAYYPLYEIRRFKTIEQENIAILNHYKSLATQAVEQDRGSLADVLRVDIRLQEALTGLDILDIREKALIATFNALLGRTETDAVLVDELPAVNLPDHGAMGKDRLAENPGFREFDLKIKASEAGEQAAYRQGLPRLGLGLDYIMVDKRSDMDIDDNGKDALMAMVTVSVPLFRSKYRASISEARLMKKSYSLKKEEFANTLRSQYETAWSDLDQQQRLIVLYERQIQTTKQALNLLMTDYGHSGRAIEDVLAMQQRLLDYNKSKTTAQVRYRTALARLNYLTGGRDAQERP